MGFHGGGFLNFSLGALSLQPEVLISTQGARIDSVNGSYDWKVTYAQFPLCLNTDRPEDFTLKPVRNLVLKSVTM